MGTGRIVVKWSVRAMLVLALGVAGVVSAVESQRYRLLSITGPSKLILVSGIPSKTKYVLDAAAARITVDGKPAEFQDLRVFSVVHVKFESRKETKDGIDIDGKATEIRISAPENLK